MPTLNTTPNRGYQEPHLDNGLSVDIGRLVAALRAIDTDMAAAFAQIVGKASLASPSFTGVPTVPTAAPGTDTGQVATTAFVRAAILALIDSSPGALDTLNELAAALGDDPNFSTTVLTAIGTKADAAATTAALATKADAAATTAALGLKQNIADRGILAGFRNKLINGAANIMQRGGRTIVAGASAYVFDRFLVTNNTNQTVTVSNIALALGSGFGREARNAMRFNFSTAPTIGTLRIEQRIEFVDSIRTADHTFIAWMSGPSGSETVAAEFVQNFGTGGSPSAQVVTPMTFAGASPTTIFSGSTNRRAWGVTVPSLSSKLLGTNGNDFAATAIVMTPRQPGNYDLTWLSFVEGDATSEDDPFTPRHRQQEVELCQRYYEKSYNLDTVPGTAQNDGLIAFQQIASNRPVHSVRFRVEKRAVPVVSIFNPVAGGNSLRSFDNNANYSFDVPFVGCSGFSVNPNTGVAGATVFHYASEAEL